MAKYNLKNIMLGIGIGVIVTATFNINSLNKPISLKDLEKQALINYDKILVAKDYVETHNLNTKKPTQTPKPSLKPSENVSPTPTLTPTLSPTSTPTIKPTATPTIKPSPTSDTRVFAAFKVDNYSTSETVANWLSNAGVVNKAEFLSELNRRSLTTKIKNGSYKIYKGESIKSIIYTLTGK